MNRNKGLLSLLTAGMLFGTFGIWIRILNQELTTFQQLIFRQLTSLILIVSLVFFLKRKWSFQGSKINLLLFALTFPFLAIFFVLAMLHTKIGVAIFSFYGTTLISSLLVGIIFFREKVTWGKIVALFLILVGLSFFVFPFADVSFNLGFYSALISGILCTINNSFKKFFKDKIDRWILLAIQMVGGLTVVSLLMFIAKESFLPSISLTIFLVIIIFGVFLTAAQFLSFIGFQNTDLNIGTIISSSEMVFATIFAALVFKEYPNLKELFGCFFILVAIIVSNLPAKAYGRT